MERSHVWGFYSASPEEARGPPFELTPLFCFELGWAFPLPSSVHGPSPPALLPFHRFLSPLLQSKRPRHSPSLRVLMASNWRRSFGNVRSFLGNSMGGLRGPTNLASWVVAGTLAYFLWVKPSQDVNRQQQERAALASPDPNSYVEKRKPIPDPQNNGLIYGNKNKPPEKNR